jgi:LDH2 family malate/lactate/ureidoglycolate dehydrogenase
MKRVNVNDLRKFTEKILISAGIRPNDTKTAVDVMLEANLCGVDSHGVRMLPGIVKLIRNGKVNPTGNIKVIKETPVIAHLDGDRVIGSVIGVYAMGMAVEKAKVAGVGLIVVKNSTHWGRPAYYPTLAARKDCIGICFTNTEANMPAWGTKEHKLGNGPLSIGAPRIGANPVVLDIAMSQAAWGKIAVFKQLGKKAPPGWGLDSEGNPTDDPDAIMKSGQALPMGQHKGAGLSLMIDIMTGILSGGLNSAELVAEGKNQPWASAYSQTFMAIDISFFSAVEEFQRRVDELIAHVKSAEPCEGFDEILVPGERAWKERAIREEEGIPADALAIDTLRELAEQVGVRFTI